VRFLLCRKCMSCSLATLCSPIFMGLPRFLFFALFSVVRHCSFPHSRSSIIIIGLSNPSAGWQDISVYRSICIFGYHYWLRKYQYALCVFIRTVRHFHTDPSQVGSVLTWDDCTVEHSAPYFYIWWMSRRVE
jgi:hypothetical protein